MPPRPLNATTLVGGGRVLARGIPNIMSVAPPATAAQIGALAAALGLELPEQYRALLAEANGVSANLVQIYPAEDVPERNATYEVAEYAPGYLVVGTAGGTGTYSYLCVQIGPSTGMGTSLCHPTALGSRAQVNRRSTKPCMPMQGCVSRHARGNGAASSSPALACGVSVRLAGFV